MTLVQAMGMYKEHDLTGRTEDQRVNFVKSFTGAYIRIPFDGMFLEGRLETAKDNREFFSLKLLEGDGSMSFYYRDLNFIEVYQGVGRPDNRLNNRFTYEI